MIYLDYNATTPLAPEAFEAMRPWLTGQPTGGLPANAHAPHTLGWTAHEAVEIARAQIAALVGAEASEVVFTSGATEACALAIVGAARRRASGGVDGVGARRHLVVDGVAQVAEAGRRDPRRPPRVAAAGQNSQVPGRQVEQLDEGPRTKWGQ